MAKARFGGDKIGPNQLTVPNQVRSLLVEADGVTGLWLLERMYTIPSSKDVVSRYRRASKAKGTGTTSVFR